MPGLIGTALALGAALALGGAGLLSAWPIGEPERLGSLQGDAWQGACLARPAGCVTCHTNLGAGGAALDTPFGSFVPPTSRRAPSAASGSGRSMSSP